MTLTQELVDRLKAEVAKVQAAKGKAVYQKRQVVSTTASGEAYMYYAYAKVRRG